MAKKAIQQRIDTDFNEWIKDISIERVKNGLEKETIPAREVTRMMMNAESITALEKELLTKQRKKYED